MPGAGITVKGTSTSVITDGNGSFSISVPDDNAVLLVKYVGYETQEVLVGSRTRIEVRLVASASSLSQVVVVGYGSQRKSDVTGAVKSLKSEDFNQGINQLSAAIVARKSIRGKCNLCKRRAWRNYRDQR